MQLFNENVGDGTQLSEEHLFAYNKDYSALYNFTKHSNLTTIPAFTPEHAPYGKALIVTPEHATLVAKFSSNGKMIIFDKEIFNEQFTVNRLDPAVTNACFINLMNFLKDIHVITSYQKFDMFDFVSTDKENYGFTVSRKERFFMDKVLGNKCTAKEVNVSRVIVMGKESFFEQMTFNFFKSFKITTQRYKQGVRFDFAFKQFNAYCVVTPENNSKMIEVFKKMAQAHLETMSIHLDNDYLFTEEFFDYYEQITAMIEI
jgi:hypothetical protein